MKCRENHIRLPIAVSSYVCDVSPRRTVLKPLIHATISAKKYGGVPEDYIPVHDFFDTSKQTLADVRHRAILHNAFGAYLCERVFGTYIVNSDGKKVSVRDIAEDHIIDDLGFIPTVEHWLSELPVRTWMSGSRKKKRFRNGELITVENLEPEPETAASRYRKHLKSSLMEKMDND